MISIPCKGMSLTSTLLALTLFTSMLFVFQKWTHFQGQSAVRIYQRVQAIQIAENQQQLQQMAQPCQQQVTQNAIVFHVNCQTKTLSYPMGEIHW